MSDEIYFVEKILDHKKVKGKKFYLIKWQGYSNSENSWEPKENINIELIKAYEDTFSSENDASIANHSNQKEKTNGKGKTVVEMPLKKDVPKKQAKDIENVHQGQSRDPPKDNIEQSTDPSSLSQQKTEEVPKTRDRVEEIIGYTDFGKKGNKMHVIVKFASQKNHVCIKIDEFRYDYPQELIDFYEKNTRWNELEQKKKREEAHCDDSPDNSKKSFVSPKI